MLTNTTIEQEEKKIFIEGAKHRKDVLVFFMALNLLFAFLIFTAPFFYWFNPTLTYTMGKYLGRLAVLVYLATTIPGISRRFKIHNPLVQLLMLYRRHIGIMSFLLIWSHGVINKFMPILFDYKSFFPLPTFSVFGISAGLALIPLFVTSNDYSVHRLGNWWGRIHRLTYVAVWLIFAHIAFQQVSVWSFIIGFFAVLQVLSFAYAYFERRRAATLSQQKIS